MRKDRSFLTLVLLFSSMLTIPAALRASVVISEEDFSGAANIFGVTSTTLSSGSACIYDSGLDGFGQVLALCNASATGVFDADTMSAGSQPLSVSGGSLTIEWDAFHGYYGITRNTAVSLVNSDGAVVAAYVYDCNTCSVSGVTIGGATPSAFSSFSFQSLYNSGSGANGWQGKGKGYQSTAGYNPHIAVTITAGGAVLMRFILMGDTTTLSGSLGAQKNDVAMMTITSAIENTDRCYAVDNITASVDDTEYFTVTYDVMGVKSTESVKSGSFVSNIPSTDIGGYIFRGWTADADGDYDTLKSYLSTADIASTPVTKDITYTAVYEVDTTYVEAIATAVITGADKMTFGPSTDEAYQNAYTVIITGVDGTTISESNLSDLVDDFTVTWDIEGFKTDNDTEGQYCDSYGAFSVNGAASVSTTFDLRDVPMNFYGRMTARITYHGEVTTAEKYVVALGNTQKTAAQVLPEAGYPVSYGDYPDDLLGYSAVYDADGALEDLILGGWCAAGSDASATATLAADADGVQYVRLTSATFKKAHVFTKEIDPFAYQLIFLAKVRFNIAGAFINISSTYPTWVGLSSYTLPVALDFDGSLLSLNGSALKSGGTAASFSTGVWYTIALSADQSSESCYAIVYDSDENEIGRKDVTAWAESSSPTFFSVGLGNTVLGSVDIASCEAFTPVPDDDSYTLSADRVTLSIPSGDEARLTATISDSRGYTITEKAVWTILEDDMQEGVIITPDSSDSHHATVSAVADASPGAATVQVSIGGYTRSIVLAFTTNKESIKFTESVSSLSIPAAGSEPLTADFAAVVVDSAGAATGADVTLAVYDKDGALPYSFGEGIAFDASSGALTVSAGAYPAVFTIRATALNSGGEELSKSVKVNVHGLTFDFGDTDAAAEGFTVVGPSTAYSDADGYGIVSGTPVSGGTASTDDAASDYLEGEMEFDAAVQAGSIYTIEVTYQGTLTTGYVNSDLAGYILGNHSSMQTETYTVAVPGDIIDLHLSNLTDAEQNDATTVARIADASITRQAARQKRSKRVVHHIGDSTSANNGSWAYRLKNLLSSNYPELAALCDFHNDGAGGRNLSTYYTEGKLASVLADICPDDVVMMGNNGTNGMGSSFEDDMNYYLDAAESLGAKTIINSYTPHGAVSGTSYADGYDRTTHTFDSYRKDSYESIARKIAAQRAEDDSEYIGFVEIGKNADAIFNAYVADYAANGYASADAAAEAIISCFSDHNHYSLGTLACDLMLGGYSTCDKPGIVSQMVALLQEDAMGITATAAEKRGDDVIITLSGQRVSAVTRPGLYIIGGKKTVIR